MKLRAGITTRVTLVLVGFAALLLLALSVFYGVTASSALEAATVSELESTATEERAALDTWITERADDVAAMAQSPGLLEDWRRWLDSPAGSPARIDAYERVGAELRPRVGPGHVYQDLFVLQPESGEVIIATDPNDEGKFSEDQPYFIEGRRAQFVQGLYYSIRHQAPAMTVAAPLRAPTGVLLGVLAANLDLATMNDVLTRAGGQRATEDSFLVTPASLFATQPRFISDPAVLRRGVHTDEVKRCLLHASGVIKSDDYRGQPVIAVYHWLDAPQLCLITKVDQAEAFAPVRELSVQLAVFSVLVLVVASLLSIALARTLTRPILGLQAGAARLARGEFDVRLPETARDELGALAREFNAMAAALMAKEAQLRGYAEGLEQKVAERSAALHALNQELEQRVRVRTEQLESANNELEAFTYSVSHDLRAPLRAISGFSHILLDEYAAQLEPAILRYLNLIWSNTQQMGQLVDDLLAFSRLSRQSLTKETVQPEPIVRRVLAELQSQEHDRAVEITVGDLAPCEADPALLKQVWTNLLSNALKFTRHREPGRIEVGCSVPPSAAGGGGEAGSERPIYFVRDNGAGFDMQYAHKLFGVFQRLHRADEYEGTGVGLAIVQRIVQRHGGRVWAEAQLDAGATFYFTL